MFLPEVKNVFVSRTQNMFLSKDIFPSLATMKAMMSRSQCSSWKMFLSNSKQTTMADGKVKLEEKEGKGIARTRRLTHCFVWLLHEVAQEDCMNRAKIWHHKVKIFKRTSPVTKKEVSSDFWRLIRKSVYYNAHEWPFVFRHNASSFSHRGSKTFCLFSVNLATPGSITWTRNHVPATKFSATMFPSLIRALVLLSPGITINFLFNPVFIKSASTNNKEKYFAQMNPIRWAASLRCRKAIFQSGALSALTS